MPVFHVRSVSANAKARGVSALERLREHVNAFRSRPLAGEDFERVERELHERFVTAEREVLGELLERLDVDVASVQTEGRRFHRVLHSTETYTTAVGTVRAKRTLYRCGRERAVVPRSFAQAFCRGALDGAGGASGELCGGADDAERGRGAAARAGQHGAVVELAGPLAQGAECAMGGESGGVRIGVALARLRQLSVNFVDFHFFPRPK